MDNDFFFSVRPCVIECGKETEMTIKVTDSAYGLRHEFDYKIVIRPLSVFSRDLPEISYTVTPKDNTLTFTHTFEDEQEYFLRVYRVGGNHMLTQLSVYALKEDLWKCEPMKGDTHVHSCRSDGMETPGMVCANYRKAGFDFMTITDHYNYRGSLEMIDDYKDVELGMTLVKGEEVHAPGNFVHIVNFGGEGSVNDICQQTRDEYEAQVGDIIKTENIPYGEAPFAYAACMWVARQIKKVGGVPIFCHPYWIEDAYNVPTELSELLMKSGEFEAFELIGGQTTFENNMQTIFYSEMLREGVDMPCVGGSDSHGTAGFGLFNMIYTVVFADSRDVKDIQQAIREGRCAAVETYEGTNVYSVHGRKRYADLALFLLRNYFPKTAQICAEEGRYMLEYVKGNKDVAEHLSSLAPRIQKFCNEFYGR